MSIDHDLHKARVKAVSDKLGHPMTYNDAGAPKSDYVVPMSKKQRKDWEGAVKTAGDIATGKVTPPYLRKGK